MVQRKVKNHEIPVSNGVSNSHEIGKTTGKSGKTKLSAPVDVEPETMKKVNGGSIEKPVARKRTSSVSKTTLPLAERKAAMNAGSSSESRGESMAILLAQGLMANDASKIDTVLTKTSPTVIQATLAELPSAEVIPLLKAIEFRLRTRSTLDIRPWIRWAQCCMSVHLSYLSSQPSLETSLGGLLDWMRNRTSHMQKLLALHGKMNVLVEELEKRRGGSSCTPSINTTPIVLFNEEEYKSDEEMESMSGDDEDRASSEEDWWDDGGVAGVEEEDDESDDDGDDQNDSDESDDDGEDEDDDEDSDEEMEV